MARIKRTTHLFLFSCDGLFLDIELLLRGAVKLTTLKQILAISILRGEEYPISMEELRVLFEIPSKKAFERFQGKTEARLTSLEKKTGI